MMTFEEWKKSKKESGTIASSGKNSSGLSDKKVLSFEEWKKSQNQGGTKNIKTNSTVQIGTTKTYDQYLNESREERAAERQAFYAKHGDNAYLMEYDLEAGQKEIDALKEELGKLRLERNSETARNVADNAYLGMPYAAAQQGSAISERDKQIAEFEKQLASMQQLYNKAKYYQYGQELASAADNEDFAQYSGYVKSDNDLYEWLNNPEFREQYEAGYQYAPNPGARKSAYKRKGYDQLTDKELSLYNYYYATEGEEKAQEYLDSIAETLNYRAGAEIASGISGKTGLEIAYGAAAGLSQFDSGIRGVASMITGKDDYIPVSRQQAAGEAVRKNLSDNGKKLPTWLGGASMGQVGYDIVSTTANMAPSILASAAAGFVNPIAGAYLGSSLMGASAAGNAYQTALNEGYDKSSARFYATSIGVSETLMQSLLGGISKLGGVSPAVTKAVSGIDDGLLRFAARYGASMAAEGIEEGLQEVLDPILQQAILNADDASVNWSDVAYSALLGALSAGTLEGVSNVRQSIQESEAKKQWTGRTDELIAEGLSYDAGTEANEIAQQYKARVDRGKSMTGAQIKNQLEANEAQRVETAAKDRLVELGETDDPAEIAKLATKRAMGEALKPAEKSRLARSKFGAQVAKELVPENAANGKIVDAMTRPGKYKPLDTRVETDVSGRVSESGKNELADSGAEFDLKQIDAKTGNDGKMVWTVDGQEATSENIKFKDEDTAYIFEAVEHIENITPTAAPVLVRSVDTSKNVIKQLNGLDEAYTYGYNGYTEADMNAGEFTSDLTDTQKMDAFRLGEAARKSRTETRVQSIKKMRTAAEAEAAQGKRTQLKITYDHGNGNVEDFRSNKVKGLTDKQRAAIKVAEMLHKLGVGTDIEFFSSYLSKTLRDPKTGKAARVFLDENGNEVAAYAGVYMGAGGKIRIDLNAYNGRRLALNAMSHELVHFVQDWSPEKYQAMAEFLASAYGETDLSMHQRVLREQERLQRTRNQDVPYAEAYDEVVANALNKMFDDGTIMTKLAELRNKDAALADKIIEGIRIIADRLLSVFNQNQYLYHDTLDLMQMGDTFKQIQDMFAEALVDASDNLQAARIAQEAFGDSANIETNENGELLLATNENKSVVMYSEQTYLNGGRAKLETALRQNGHTETEITETLSYVDDALDYIKVLAAGYAKQMGYTNLSNHLIADVITNVKTGKQVMSSIVNNGDYPVNIDLSLICKKRVAYMNLMSRLIRDGVFDKVNYDGAAIAEVNNILRENGFETACLGCFVESRRLQFQTWAETIVSEWNAEVEKRNPKADNFGFAKGDMKSLTDSDINELTRELESVKKNDQGNVNLGQGNSVTRMGRLLDALPSLQKKLTVEDLLTPEGLTALRQHDGSLFSIVKSRYGAASPKIVQDFNPYASEIAMLSFAQVKNITSNAVKGAQTYVKEVKSEYGKIVRANGESKENFNKRKKLHEQRIQDEAMRRYLYDIGGARIQSFSDFMIENVFDYIQIFADLAAKRLPLHGYTKEIVCMRLFGMTGAKWNGSLIAHVERAMGKELAGLLPAGTKDGIPVKVDGKDYVIGFDDYARNAATNGESFIQSIGMKDILALQLDPRYSPYVGNITIGVSDAQIMAMLDSPLFRMVIPYHASGMLPMFAKLVGVDMYNDYTDYQNTTVRQYYDLNGNAVSELKNAKGDAVKADTSYAFNAEIQKTGDAKTAANNYLKWCAQRHPVYDGKTLVGYATFNPKFSSSPYGTDFTRHENYYKLLEDFNTYDSVTEESAVQGAVTMNFPSEENRLNEQQMAEYKNALRETGVFTEQDIEKYSKKADMTFKEIINAEVGNRANYAATQAPKWEATVKEVEAKLQKDYARQRQSSQETDLDSDGNRLSVEQQEYFADSVVRDADGRLLVMYHGTSKGGHNVFDPWGKSNYGLFGTGTYFTDSKSVAESYTDKGKGNNKQVYVTYLNIKNPLDMDAQADPAQWTRSFYDIDFPQYGTNEDFYRAVEEYYADQYMPKWEVAEIIRDTLEFGMGYDGITHIGGGRVNHNGERHQVYIAFQPEQIKNVDNKKPTADADIRYSSQETDFDGFKDYDVVSAVYTIRNEKAKRGHDLVEIGNMPTLYRELFDLSGKVYVSNEHLYQNMVSRDTAIAEGRYNEEASADYHELDEAKIINAIEQFQDPIAIMESLKNFREPRLVAILDEKGTDGKNLIAVLELYSKQRPQGVSQKHNHVLITIYEKSSLPDYIEKTADKDRVLYIKEGSRQISQAGLQLAGEISKETLKKNVSRFNKKVKDFKAENKILYSTQETDPISNRHLLANAFEGISRSSVEYGMIQDYKRNIDKLNKLEEQLSDVNAEIRQLRFGKDVERDPERLRELEEKADGLAKEINKYDKRLINMEASEPLRKVLDRERKKAAQKTRQRVNEIQKNRKTRKEQAEIKKKIRRVIRDLDKLFNRGDKKRNVKDGLRDFVEHAIKATDVLFMENVSKYDVLRNGFSTTLTTDEKRIVNEAEILLGKLDKAYADSTEQNPYNDPAFVNAEKALDAKLDELDSVFEREKIAREEKSVAEVLAKLKAEYKKLEKADQFAARSAYSDAVYDHMTQLADVIGDTKVRDMTTEQLNSLYEMYNWVKATVTMANKFFSENMQKSVEETAKQSVQEFKLAEAKRKTSKTAEKVYAALDAVGWSNEKVIYALRRLNNSAITTLMQNIIDGENVTMRDVREAIKFRRETEKKYNVKKWDLNEVHTFDDTIGNQFELTLAQMLSFYAYSRREAARSHITRGGIVIKPATKLKKGTATAYTISEDGIAEIQNALTKEQRDYVVAMQTYLSDVMGAKGNEVSMKLHGIKMFNEESYFPIRSSDKYLSKAAEADLKNQIGITNMASAGFTNSLVKDAATPIEIGDFIDTWANHVNEMSRYHGFVLPMEDFRKVFNFSKYADKSTSTAVRAAMENAFGRNAVKYFDDLYRDLNSSAATDRESEKTYRKLFSRFKKSAVMYSLSVVVQQPTAIVRAGAMIDRKYFGAFGSTGRIATGIGRLFTSNHTKLWEEMMTYAPGVTMIKDIGGFDTATGGSVLQALMEDSYEGIKENFEAFKKHPLEYIAKKADDNFLSKIPAYADQIAWVEIWNAVKRETLSKNKDMVANSQVHLEASGKRFSEVIRATQVYDSVFAKSPQMRSKSLAMQMLTSFMAEPNTTINMVEDGIREFVRGNKNFGARELYTVAAAIAFNNLIKAVVYAMRADDEDKNFEEKYLAAVIDGLLNDFNPLTYFAGARDVWSVMRGYDIERADMTLISDVVENLSRVKNLSDKDTSEMTEEQLTDHEKKQTDAWWALADSISAIVGFPIKNIRRDVKGFVNTVFGERIGSSTKNSIAYVVEEAVEDAKPQMFRNEKQSKSDRLYEVYVNGDREYLNRIKGQYEDEDAFNKALRKALRENDSRIHEAAQALYENNAAEYSKKFNAILREGNFSSHDIREAIDSELSKIKSDSIGETSASAYNTSDFVKSIIVGDNASAKEIRKEYIANKTSAGMTKEDAEKAFEESVNGNVRDSFKAKLLSKDMAQKIMVRYGGKSKEEVEDKLTCWEFQREYPDVDISDNAILDYYDIAEPLGIKLSSYLTFVNGKKGAKKDQVVTTIHKLSLTQKQKDALYLMAGYAESGLWNTPWHR